MGQVEIKGWTRTTLLAIGAGSGVLVTAGILHVLKKRGVIR